MSNMVLIVDEPLTVMLVELVYHGSQWLVMISDDQEWLMITGLWVLMFMVQNFASQADRGRQYQTIRVAERSLFFRERS